MRIKRRDEETKMEIYKEKKRKREGKEKKGTAKQKRKKRMIDDG